MFWMVVGKGAPVFKHDSLEAARNEAARLAKQNPGQSFNVLESVATCVATGVSWEELRVDKPVENTPKSLPNHWSFLSPSDTFRLGDKVTYHGDTLDSPWEDISQTWVGRTVNEWSLTATSRCLRKQDLPLYFAARSNLPF